MGRRRVGWCWRPSAAGLALGLAVVFGATTCGVSTEDAADVGESSSETPSSDIVLDVADQPGDVPRTTAVLTELSLDESTDIERLMAYAEGGDDPCAGDYDAPLDRPRLVDYAYRESDVVQIGWDYKVCWGAPVDQISMRYPTGELVPQQFYGPLPILPGSPTGTYRLEAEFEGTTLEAPVEVVATTEPRLFVDPSVFRAPFAGDPTAAADLLLYLVGVEGRSSVPVAVYEDVLDGEVGELIGVVPVELDASGAGSLFVERGPDLTVERCVTFVMDPPEAVARWGEVGELWSRGGREVVGSGYGFDIGAQMIERACFAPT